MSNEISVKKLQKIGICERGTNVDDRIKALSGGNMDIDLSSERVDWKQTQCPWNIEDNTNKHKCAVKGTSICKYFCGIKFLDSVLCSYPYENSEVFSSNDIDRDLR